MDIAKELLRLKDSIEEAQRKKDILSGKIESLHEELKENFNCQDIEEAKILLSKLESEVKKEQNEIEEELKTLKEKFNDE